jgi:hypothetical protein
MFLKMWHNNKQTSIVFQYIYIYVVLTWYKLIKNKKNIISKTSSEKLLLAGAQEIALASSHKTSAILGPYRICCLSQTMAFLMDEISEKPMKKMVQVLNL